MEKPRTFWHQFSKWAIRVVVIAVLVNVVILFVPYAERKPASVSTQPIERVTSAETTTPVVYLTFDAGNAPDKTVPELLTLLEQEDITATFFLTGRWTVLHPFAAHDIADAGHVLASHGFNHAHMTRWPHTIQRAELWWADQTITLICGRQPVCLFRPPSGDTSAETQAYWASLGWRTVMWSKDLSDWRLDGSVSVQSILSKIEPIEDGDVICFHLRNFETVDALREIIPQLKAEGFEFRTLEDVAPNNGETIGSSAASAASLTP